MTLRVLNEGWLIEETYNGLQRRSGFGKCCALRTFLLQATTACFDAPPDSD
jgi:hypothetical protein